MNSNQALYPSLHHRKGWLRHQKNFAKPSKPTQPGWFSFLFSAGHHPGLAKSGCFAIFLDRSATPPRGYARREYRLISNLFTASTRLHTRLFQIAGARNCGTMQSVHNQIIESDVVVVGGGNAGLCAALTARESGASVTVLECAPV